MQGEASARSLVSIIIPTYNSAAVLERCLAAIREQTYHHVEVVVVDQSSQDRSVKIALAAGARVLQLPAPAFYSPPTESRNAGALAATGSILYHLDSDMAPSASLLEDAVNMLAREPDVVALVVPEVDEGTGYWSRCKALERRCYWGNDAMESARIVRASAFKALGGYDVQLNSGEDFDIHRRYQTIGRIGRTTALVTHDLNKLSFLGSLRKKYNYGRTARRYFDKQGETGAGLVRIQLTAFFRHRAELRREPLVGLGMIGLKASEMAAGFAGDRASRFDARRRRLSYTPSGACSTTVAPTVGHAARS